jgi:hypothetical protein
LSASRRRSRGLAAVGLALCAAAVWPEAAAALQIGAVLDLGTGPATWDQVETEGARAKGTVAASFSPARLLGLQPEVAGGLGLSTEPAARTALRWDVIGRLHAGGAGAGFWLGAGVGGAGTSTRAAALTRLEGGVRSGVGPAGLRVWLARTTFGTRPTTSGRLGNGAEGDTIGPGGKQVVEYTDLGTRAALNLGRYDLGATLIRRWGTTALRNTAWELSGVWWIRPSLGLVASAGHSLPEFSLALPGARYRSLGVRLAVGAPPRGGPPRGRAPPAAGPAATPRLVLASPRRLALVGPTAGRAEVMGDFTDWRPRSLAPAGEGRWILDEALSRGVHQLNVRFDGGEWVVPEGTVVVDDGFGGQVGLFVVR